MPIMSIQPFNIPCIPPDLRREETIHHIVDSLEYLDKIANQIFTRIHTHVAEDHARLHKINDRVSLAQAKVDKLKGSNKATKVFASAKYPVQDDVEIHNALFKGNTGLEFKRHSYKVPSKHSVVDDTTLKEKLQFFNVHINRKKKNEEMRGEGLGGLPKDIRSISSLLLFNTTENPYKKYVMLDPLGVVTKTRTILEEEEERIAEAPSTIVQREELQRQQMDNYFYIPDIGQVPEIAVPDFLPNLLGVADDESYGADIGPSIAPSVFGSNIPDLPSVVPEAEALPPPPGGTQTVPPPPSGPPPPPSGPPPPPPPPGDGSAKIEGAPEEVVSPTDGRASLMDAIRKAGGAGKAKLKSAKEKKIEKKKKAQEEKNTGGEDLAMDFIQQLRNKFKGIHGKSSGGEKKESSNSGVSAIDKIAAMIPAPPQQEKAEGDDEDWE